MEETQHLARAFRSLIPLVKCPSLATETRRRVLATLEMLHRELEERDVRPPRPTDPIARARTAAGELEFDDGATEPSFHPRLCQF